MYIVDELGDRHSIASLKELRLQDFGAGYNYELRKGPIILQVYSSKDRAEGILEAIQIGLMRGIHEIDLRKSYRLGKV